MCHFMIVDDTVLTFGLFEVRSSGVQIGNMSSFLTDSSTPTGAQLVKDFRAWFETIFEEFAT